MWVYFQHNKSWFTLPRGVGAFGDTLGDNLERHLGRQPWATPYVTILPKFGCIFKIITPGLLSRAVGAPSVTPWATTLGDVLCDNFGWRLAWQAWATPWATALGDALRDNRGRRLV